MKVKYLILLIFLFGFLIRIFSILPYNTEIGFDQARDLFSATTIFRDHHLAIIGPTAGNNPNLHHGVAFWYYMVIPLILIKGNPVGVLIWNCLFSALTIFVLYFFAKDFFKSKKAGIVAAILFAVSYQIINYAGWLSNPTVTIFTVPIFFYALWKYYLGQKKWLPIAFLFLGITIEFELFFIYLIPIGIILFLLLRMKWPDIKILLLSILLFCVSTSTMIATEIKFHFAGIKSIFGAGNYLSTGVAHKPFLEQFFQFLTDGKAYANNFSPNYLNTGLIIGVVIIFFLLFDFFKYRKNRMERNKIIFLIVYFLSPAFMFLLGVSNEPWFFIGRPIAIILAFTYILLKVKSKILISCVLIFITALNIIAVNNLKGHGQVLLEPDPASIMNDQIKAIDYTYQSSNGSKFSINTLTNPLYVNSVWGYQYYWYGNKNYGYIPSFSGGDQLYPYNTLPKFSGDEKYLYLVIDTTPRIPPQYRQEILNWANKEGRLMETKMFGGIEVQKWMIQ